MIIPVYQPLGSSSHRLAQKLGVISGQPTTHTGTLDPMAEGVVICLTGEDRFQKKKHASVEKKYVFTVVAGFSTDSHDLLGLSSFTAYDQKKLSNIDQAIHRLKGEQNQVIPHFSAKRINGKSYFDKAKENVHLPEYCQTVFIHTLQIIKTETVALHLFEEELKEKLLMIDGDFRQSMVLKSWETALGKASAAGIKKIWSATLAANVSKRTYIRGIVRDLAETLQVPLTTRHILRQKNGLYSIKDCICLV